MTTTAPNFDFDGQNLRTVIIDGQPWFAAPDACRILGMGMEKGTSHHLRKLAADEKQIATRQGHPVLFTECFAQSFAIVSEPGLYKLIQRSNKPEPPK